MKIKNILKYYKEKNITILFSCHVIEFLDNFIDHCILLKEGTIAENKSIENIDSLEKLYIGHIPENIFALPFENKNEKEVSNV
jgi:ABC-type Na+ transport system ATPase subunit NatA